MAAPLLHKSGSASCLTNFFLLLFGTSASSPERPQLLTSTLAPSHHVFSSRPCSLVPSSSNDVQRLIQHALSLHFVHSNQTRLTILINQMTGSHWTYTHLLCTFLPFIQTKPTRPTHHFVSFPVMFRSQQPCLHNPSTPLNLRLHKLHYHHYYYHRRCIQLTVVILHTLQFHTQVTSLLQQYRTLKDAEYFQCLTLLVG